MKLKVNKCLYLNLVNIDWDHDKKFSHNILAFTEGIHFDEKITYNDVEKSIFSICESFCEKGEKRFDPKVHTKYYRYPKINLSRDKMDNCKEKYGMAKVLNKDKADFRVIGPKQLQGMTEQHWRASLSSLQSVRNYIAKSDADLWQEDAHQKTIDNIDALIQKYGADYTVVAHKPGYYRYHASGQSDPIGTWLDDWKKGIGNEAHYLTSVKSNHVKTFTEIYDDTTNGVLYVSDVFMNNLASEDSHVLSGKDYKNIRNLLRSQNVEDRNVGMSIMANCNIQKSKTYLALLFFHFSETLRGTSMWNQVAFKSLRREFDKYCLEYNHYHSNRYSQCVQYLAEDGALTVNAAEHLISIMFDNVINQSTGINSDNNMFILDKASVKLAPQVKEKVRNDVDLSQIALDLQSDLPF